MYVPTCDGASLIFGAANFFFFAVSAWHESSVQKVYQIVHMWYTVIKWFLFIYFFLLVIDCKPVTLSEKFLTMTPTLFKKIK